MNLPDYKVSILISHNAHKGVYETAEDSINYMELTEDDFLFPEDMETCKKTNSLWEVHWYPDTPVGFYVAFGSTLEYALAKAARIQLEIDEDKV